MIRSIVKMSKKYFPKEQRSNEFIPFIETLDTDGFDRILKNIPPGIVNREPDEFTEYDEVSIIDFKKN